MANYKVIAFDADDTLWVNEPYFREAEEALGKLLSEYETDTVIQQDLYKVITGNVSLYGYGVKSCILSMIQYATEVSNNKVSAATIQKILEIGTDMLTKPIELLSGVVELLQELSKEYTLIVLTKGDLLDQEKKLERSGLLHYFHHVEVMSEKNTDGYLSVLKHLDILPNEFLMIGNSLKSDILPVLEIGGKAIHIPYHSIWQFETVSQEMLALHEYPTLTSISQVVNHLE